MDIKTKDKNTIRFLQLYVDDYQLILIFHHNILHQHSLIATDLE